MESDDFNGSAEHIEELKALLQNTGDRIADLFDQLVKGNWTDDHGHDVKMNTAMLGMCDALVDLGEYRAKRLGYSEYTVEATK